MKKILTVTLAILTVFATCIGVNAFDLKQAQPTIDGEVIFDLPACEGAGWVGDTIFNWEAGESFCVKMDTYVYFPFTAPSDGVYTVVVNFIGREGSDRAFDIEIDDTGRQFIDITESNDHQWAIIDFTTTAGDHEFRLWSPTDMDDTTLKSVDTYHVSLYLTAPAIEVEEVSIPEAVTEPAADIAVVVPQVVTAPQTSDSAVFTLFSISIAIILIIALRKRINN